MPKPDGKMAETRIKVLPRLILPPVYVLCIRRTTFWLCLLVLPCTTTRTGPRQALHRPGPNAARQPCTVGRRIGLARAGRLTCLQVDVETDLPKVQQQLAAQAAAPGGPESPSTPQTGVWNQHTGGYPKSRNAHQICTSTPFMQQCSGSPPDRL